MINYEDLEVYKCTYDLLTFFYQRTRRVDRDYRFTLCQDARAALHEVLFHIYMATTLPQAEQSAQVVLARGQMARFKVFYRLLQSLGQLRKKDIEVMNMAVANIITQLKKWEAYLRKQFGFPPVVAYE